ncbi:hypothetical protein EAL2_c20230 [Peptoclostridium acidaminophilum DSM 3953]|uniref:Uncharacterized protein n=1 Tax=Peptoclostridium acidaminophilum DSM 3953 TaxID=1286171 RepID=W8T6C7_PEPAC|nr:hypothetical protein [Peptoclostridium acidaminophilum]AHM57304.1 hypothetical protein EAL2_c20230 [Peptoclostridium acidaminophilum DSM 3953]
MKKGTIAKAAAVLFVIGALFMAFSGAPAVKFIRYAGASLASQNPEEDKQIEELQEQVGQEMDKAIEEEMKKQSEENAKQETGSEAPKTQAGSSENQANTDKSQSAPTKESIVAKYRGRLEALRGASYGQINSLLGQAKGEYLSYPAEEREEVKYQIALKYMRLARGAESAVDARFNAIVGELEAELKRNGHATDAVDKARREYKTEKRERMEYYISKAM